MTVVQSARRNSFAHFVWLVLATLAIVSPAQAAPARPNGYPVTNVNLRAGPGTYYPVIVVVPARSWITIRGCLGDHTWCDVTFEGSRGWMRSIYLQGWYRGHYYALRDYAPRLGYPVVTFDLGPYWDNYYRDRPFYSQRARWGAPRGEGWANRSTFYGRLAPYGSWIWLQGQYVWVPRNVGPYWRPYTVGRWVFTDRYGWMWVSDEPFGWATYHYGRWGFSNRVGWFWVPGSRWAPAWVSWRSSNDYLAWAPLPPTPDEGLSINITVGNVPDYYWQVVPNRDFLAPDLPRRIVRDRDRYDPILRDTRPIGNVTVVNNTVVNNVVNVTYVEEKTKKKVVVYKVEKTKDEDKAKGGGKVKGEAVEVFQPAPEVKPAVVAPAETKPIEEVAAESKTKQQGEGAAATDELLVPAEIKKPLEAEAKPPAPPPPPPPASAPEGAAPAAETEEAAPPPPPPPPPPAPAEGAAEPTPAPSEDAATPPPPPAEGATPPSTPPVEETVAPPPPANGASPPVPSAPTGDTAPTPPPPAEATPPPPPPVEEAAPPPPPPPAEEAAPPPPPPPAKEETPPPPPAEEAAPPPPPPVEKEAPPPVEKSAPPPPAPAEDMPPPPPPEEAAPPPPPPPVEEPAPKAKKEEKPKKDRDMQPDEPTFAPPPPPPPAEDAAPAPPPADEPAPKPKKEGKPKKDRDMQPDDGGPPSFAPPPPPGEDMAPPPPSPMSGDDAPRAKEERKPKKKKDKDEPCPEGMVLLEDGNCVPSQ